VAIFCGKGNNGGDGFVACRHLLTLGLSSEVFLAGEISEIKKEAKVNLEILLKMQQKVKEINLSNLYLLKRQIAQYTLMIDALLGVGLKGVVRGIYADLIKLMNSQAAYILAVDIPSGLDASSGRVLGTCVKADKTVSLIAKKRGMVLRDGPKYCGRVVVRDIGIPLSNLRL
jgi:NAD(P)H-hydrate epimerase